MRTILVILPAAICGVLFSVAAAPVAAQTTAQERAAAAPVAAQTTAQERAASMRLQLAELQDKQADLQTRLRQLEEDLKTENIEKGFAGVGSTHPEDLREQRRREMEIERTNLRTQLDLLATSRTRLETGIAQADADAYRQSAGPNTGGTLPKLSGNDGQQTGDHPSVNTSPTLKRRPRRVNRNRPRTSPKPRRIRRPA